MESRSTKLFLRQSLACGLLICAHAVGAAEQVVRFDMGPADSPCPHGYQRITPANIFPGSGNAGWAASQDLRGVMCAPETVADDRGVFGFRRATRFFANDVTRDLIIGRAPTVLVVRPPFKLAWMGLVSGVPGKGDYRGKAADELAPPMLDMQVTVNGRPIDSFTVPQPGMMEFRSYEVEGPDILKIRFASPNMAWGVNALILASAEGKAAAAVELDALKQSALFLPADQRAWWRREPERPSPSVTAGNTPFRVVARSPLADFRTPPKSTGGPARLRAFATPGEDEPLAFAVLPFRRLHRVRVSVSDLTQQQGAVIPGRSVTIRQIQAWPTKIDQHWRQGRGRYELRPELLLPWGDLDLPSGRRADFYVNVRVPASAEPGCYRGSLVVAPANMAPQELPVELTVLPFALPRLPLQWVGTHYDPPLLQAELYRKSRYYEEIRERLGRRESQELADMQAHGVNSFATSIALGVVDNRLWLDEARIRHVFALFGKYRLRAPIVLMLDFGPLLQSFGRTLYRHDLRAPAPPAAFFERAAQAVRRIEAMAQVANAPAVCYIPYDYWGDWTHCLFVARLMSALKPVVGERLMVCCGQELVPYVDLFVRIRCYRLLDEWRAPFNENALAIDMRRSKKVLWLAPTDLSLGLGVQPAVARYEAGFYARKHEATGILLGEYQGQDGNPFNALDSLSRGQGLTFPSAQGPLSTLAWEGIREAVDDLRYAQALDSLVNSTKTHPKSSLATAARQAERDMRRLLASLPGREPFLAALDRPDRDLSAPSDVLPRLRWRIAWRMGKLAGAVAGRRPTKADSTDNQISIECTRQAARPAKHPQRKVARCVLVTRPPVIDGKLDDDCWAKAHKMSDFVESEFGASAGPVTHIQLCADERNVYVGFTCEETEAEKQAGPRFEADQRDAPLRLDDSVHVFLDPNNTRRSCFQIGVNRSGAVLDLRVAPYPSLEWNSGATARVAAHGGHWTVEFALPKPQGGDVQNDFWGFNAARRVMGQPHRWLVWRPGGREPGDPEHLGRLVFERDPCYIADVRMGHPQVGVNRYAVNLVNTSRAAFAGRLSAVMKRLSARSERADFKVSVEAGQDKWYTVHQPLKHAGRGTLALALYPDSSQEPVSLVVRTDFEVRPIVDVRLGPANCPQGESILGTMRVSIRTDESRRKGTGQDPIFTNAEDRKPQQTQAEFTLRRKGGRRSIHTQSETIDPDQAYTIRIPTQGLRAGTYELRAEVIVGGETQGKAAYKFSVFDNF